MLVKSFGLSLKDSVDEILRLISCKFDGSLNIQFPDNYILNPVIIAAS